MMQDRLQKTMLVCSILLSTAAMSVMLYFSATKTIIIAEEAPEWTDAARQPEERRENALYFEADERPEGVRIPLPAEIRADDIVIENRYVEHRIHIILTGKYGEFYRTNPLLGNDSRVTAGFLQEENGMTDLQLQMSGLYEHQYMFENGELQLSFVEPGQLYDSIVVLDAAHGGSDIGHTGNGIQEKDIVLEITEMVKEKLESENIRVYCTRTDDTELSEKQRADFVNELQADLLVSVRAGADEGSSQVSGIQTFYNGTYFLPYFGNVQLADLLERNTIAMTGGKANGLMEAGNEDILLWNVQVPAAAIEVGYVTNQEEAELLLLKEYKERLAEGIANAVREANAVRAEGF